jgi:hypothetical protein
MFQWPRGVGRRFWSLGRWNRGFESSLRQACLCSFFCVVLSCQYSVKAKNVCMRKDCRDQKNIKNKKRKKTNKIEKSGYHSCFVFGTPLFKCWPWDRLSCFSFLFVGFFSPPGKRRDTTLGYTASFSIHYKYSLSSYHSKLYRPSYWQRC